MGEWLVAAEVMGGFETAVAAAEVSSAAMAASAATSAAGLGIEGAAGGMVQAGGLGPGFFDGIGSSIASEISSRPFGSAMSGIGALSALAGGQAGYDASQFARMQYEEEAANARAAATQDETQRLRRLRSTLATQNALRAGRGVELFAGGSGEAIRKDTIAQTEEDSQTSRLNLLSRARRFDLAAGQEDVRGRSAILGGVGGAASALSPAYRY